MAKIGTLITYDVFDNQPEIKQGLIDEGWSDVIEGLDEKDNVVISHLPNTSLWHKTKSVEQTIKDFERIAGSENIERSICFEFDNWLGVPGKPHKMDKK